MRACAPLSHARARVRAPDCSAPATQYVTMARMAQASGWPLRYVAYEDLLTNAPGTLRCLWPAECAREVRAREVLSGAMRRALGASGAPRHGPKDRWTIVPTKTLEGALRSHVRNFEEVEAHFAAQREGEGGALAPCFLEMLRASGPQNFDECLREHIERSHVGFGALEKCSAAPRCDLPHRESRASAAQASGAEAARDE